MTFLDTRLNGGGYGDMDQTKAIPGVCEECDRRDKARINASQRVKWCLVQRVPCIASLLDFTDVSHLS